MRVTQRQLNFLDRIAGMNEVQLRKELSRAHMQLDRWQALATVDHSQIIARAEKEGVEIEDNKALGTFVREFIRKAWT